MLTNSALAFARTLYYVTGPSFLLPLFAVKSSLDILKLPSLLLSMKVKYAPFQKLVEALILRFDVVA